MKDIYFIYVAVLLLVSFSFIDNDVVYGDKTIPDWIKNVFVWYGNDQIGETDVINALKYLVQNKIIDLDDTIVQKSSIKISGTEFPPGKTQVPPGWSTPVKLGFNDDGWEDSPFLSNDGKILYFMYYPGDLFTDVDKDLATEDIDIYTSEYPFSTKKIHPISRDLYSEAGPFVAANGDFYFHANWDGEFDQKYDEDIYKNGKRMDFNTERNETNPHYCESEDELYFDNLDNEIWLYKNNTVTKLGYPINTPDRTDYTFESYTQHSGVQNFQPFLTDDCQTMYFTSTRDSDFGVPYIYKSHRLGELEWSEPELFVYNSGGVGEISMTADGNQMTFAIMSIDSSRVYLDIYYSQKE